MNNKNEKKQKNIKEEVSSVSINGQPETSFEIINKYGTYNIQPTNDSENEFPEIAQGISKKQIEDKKKEQSW